MAVGNLEFIKSATGSSVSSLSVTDCFSDNYDVYAVTIAKLEGLASSGNRLINMRFIDGTGSIISSTQYDWAAQNLRSYSAFTDDKTVSDNAIERVQIYGSDNLAGGTVLYIYNPYSSSSYTFTAWQSGGLIEGPPRLYGLKGIGVHKSTQTITGVAFVTNADNVNLTVNVYGVK